MRASAFAMIVLFAGPAGLFAAEPASGVVSHISVVANDAPDVSNLEAWKHSYIKPGMTDQQKALAIWETCVAYRHQDMPPLEYITGEAVVSDPIKMFNVYGYGFCSVASANVEALARYVGLDARGWGISNHSVPEIKVDGNWCMFDSSLINYFRKNDGSVAGVEEISKDISAWYETHPDYRNNNDKLLKFMGREGWKKGPPVLSSGRYDENGWLPAATHGWYSTMWEFGNEKKNFVYEYGAAIGYQVNIQLRPGEQLVRNWSNKGLEINTLGGDEKPGCLNGAIGKNDLRYSPGFGDLAPGRIGNGTFQYDLPLANGAFKNGMLAVDNLASQSEDGGGAAVHVKDAARPGVLIFRVPSSYVYLTGELVFSRVVMDGGSFDVAFSDNNGLDWKDLARATTSGEQKIDLKPFVFRKYDYRLKFTFTGKGTGANSIKVTHDIQHSQRPLPALIQGDNHIHFAAAAQEGTITIQGAINPAKPGKNLMYGDFHPTLDNIDPQWVRPTHGAGQITFPIQTPGDISRIRVGAFYRARDAKHDGWTLSASFDNGKTWKPVGELEGPYAGHSKYFVFSDVPSASRAALVCFSGKERNTTLLLDLRIDADYVEPHGGFAPVKVTYAWDENGQAKSDVHISTKADDAYVVKCEAKPTMKSITLELP